MTFPLIDLKLAAERGHLLATAQHFGLRGLNII